jgi:hypothetical protein
MCGGRLVGGGVIRGGGVWKAEAFAGVTEEFLAAAAMGGFLVRGTWGRRWRGGRLWGRERGAETDPSDVEVLLEAVGLEEIGELEGADVAAFLADLALEVGDDLAEVVEGEAGAEPLEPVALAVKAQREALAGELAVELMGVGDEGGGGEGIHERGSAGAVAGGWSRPGTQGTVWRAV